MRRMLDRRILIGEVSPLELGRGDCGPKLEPNWNQIGTKLEPNWNISGFWGIFVKLPVRRRFGGVSLRPGAVPENPYRQTLPGKIRPVAVPENLAIWCWACENGAQSCRGRTDA